MSHNNHSKTGIALALSVSAVCWLAGCAATVPETAVVANADIPDYKVAEHRIDEPIDVYIEPRIRSLRQSVTPRSDRDVYNPIPVVVGPALERALLNLTRQHFARSTPVPERRDQPVLSFELLSYKPAVAVVPGILSTRLNVSARLALQVSVHGASGETLFSTTAIGTSHVSDTKIAAGDGLKDGPRLVGVATQDAITDAMYEISRLLGNGSSSIDRNVRASKTDPGLGIETFDDVILHLRTRRVDPT